MSLNFFASSTLSIKRVFADVNHKADGINVFSFFLNTTNHVAMGVKQRSFGASKREDLQNDI